MSEQLAAQAHAFIWAFNLPGFGELAEELVTEDGKLWPRNANWGF